MMIRIALALTFALAVLPGSAHAATPAPPPGCSSAESHQFDFWVGDWNVYDPAGNLTGTNDVTLEYGTCVVHEHWKGAQGGDGESFNFYYPQTKRWHQTWVSNSGYLFLDGGMQGNAMVLSGERTSKAGKRIVDRITYTPGADGSVRQVWDYSTDGGATWTNLFDGKYVRKAK